MNSRLEIMNKCNQTRISKGFSLRKHFILVFCAYTFILWHKLTWGLRRRWENKPLNTFPDPRSTTAGEALEAFRTGISYRFVQWLNQNSDVFAAHKASKRLCLGLIFVQVPIR